MVVRIVTAGLILFLTGSFLSLGVARLKPGTSQAATPQSTSASSLQATVEQQGKLIAQLQAEVSALQHASKTTSGTSKPSGAPSIRAFVPGKRAPLKLASTHDKLAALETSSVKFKATKFKLPPPLPGSPHFTPVPLQQQINDLSNALAQVTQQVTVLDAQVQSDESNETSAMSAVYGDPNEIATTIDGIPTSWCGNGEATWSSFTSGSGNYGDLLICFDNPGRSAPPPNHVIIH